jgi:hypothetical protein
VREKSEGREHIRSRIPNSNHGFTFYAGIGTSGKWLIMEEDMIEQDNQISEFDLTRFFRTLWKRKGLILGGTAMITVLIAVICLVLPKVYRSGGFFQLSGISQRISVTEYKKNTSFFSSPVRFVLFVREKGYFPGKALKYLMDKYKDPDDLSKAISPIFSYSKEDINATGQGSPEVNYVLGASIYAENDSADSARQTVNVLGMYLRDCILYAKLNDYVNYKYNNANAAMRKIENQIIDANFSLGIQMKKKEELKLILGRYPDAGKYSSREIIQPGNDGYRYLSPVTQLVGCDSTIADIKGMLSISQRDQEKAAFELEVFQKAREIVSRNKFGEKAFQDLLNFSKEFFKTRDLTRDSIRTVVNHFYIEMETYRTLFFEDMRFLSGPPLPAKVVAPKKRLIVAVAFFLAFFFFLFVTLMIEWWQKNKETIVSNNSRSV